MTKYCEVSGAKIEEIEKFNTKIDNLLIEAQKAEIEYLKIKLGRALEAIEFYADRENWDMENMSPTIWDDGQIDCGKRAREFLKEMGEL